MRRQQGFPGRARIFAIVYKDQLCVPLHLIANPMLYSAFFRTNVRGAEGESFISSGTRTTSKIS